MPSAPAPEPKERNRRARRFTRGFSGKRRAGGGALLQARFPGAAEDADRLDRALHVRLTRQPHRLALPAPAHERERLQEPQRQRELLELRRRGEILGSGERNHGAGRAEAVPAAPLPQARIGFERRVPETVALPDVDLLAVDDAAHAAPLALGV